MPCLPRLSTSHRSPRLSLTRTLLQGVQFHPTEVAACPGAMDTAALESIIYASTNPPLPSARVVGPRARRRAELPPGAAGAASSFTAGGSPSHHLSRPGSASSRRLASASTSSRRRPASARPASARPGGGAQEAAAMAADASFASFRSERPARGGGDEQHPRSAMSPGNPSHVSVES